MRIDVTLSEKDQVVSDLRKGTYLWTNEGKDLKAWLGDEYGNPIKAVDVDVANDLFMEGRIFLTDGDYPGGLYRYSLTVK